MRFEVVFLVESVAHLCCFVLAEHSFGQLQFQVLFVLFLFGFLLFSLLGLPFLFQNSLSLSDDVLRALIDGRTGVALVEKEGVRVLHPVVDSLFQLAVHDLRLLL